MPQSFSETKNPERKLFSSRATFLVLVTLGILATFAAFRADKMVAVWAGAAPEWLEKACSLIGEYGDFPLLVGFGLLLLGVAWLRKDRRLVRVVLCMLIAGAISGVTARAIKVTTGRTRPTIPAEKQGWYGPVHEGRNLIGKSKYNSFPSGHTAFVLALLWVVVLQKESRWRWAALAVVPIVPVARILTNSHHFSDIVAASFLAIIVAWLVVRKAEGAV